MACAWAVRDRRIERQHVLRRVNSVVPPLFGVSLLSKHKEASRQVWLGWAAEVDLSGNLIRMRLRQPVGETTVFVHRVMREPFDQEVDHRGSGLAGVA
jgi:hypothetical protein